MNPADVAKLRRLTNFQSLVDYLRDELDWPIEAEDADDITFSYDPAELGIDPQHAVKIDDIKQVRKLTDDQPWGIFYLQFESKRLPVVVLRRILRSLVPRSRGNDPDRPVWRMSDLLFISAQGETGYRSVSFAHFRQREGHADELRTFSWDSRETHFHYIKNLNLEALRWPEDEDDAAGWSARWSSAFTAEHRYTITRSQELAREMARHAKIIRELVSDVYEFEIDSGPLHRLYAGFKEALLHDLTPGAFADMVAQTVAYGLFSARTQSKELTLDCMVELIPSTNPFLKDLLSELTVHDAVDLEELGIDQLVDLLCQTDMDAILHDFGRQTGGGREDPVIHFYELFMSEYDKAQRIKRGEFYTPDPVVSYIVRSVDHLLQTEFGLADGLADTTTWGQMAERMPGLTIPEGVSPDEPFVQILDPATGTGTFGAMVIDVVHETMTTKWQRQGMSEAEIRTSWNKYVTAHLLPRLHGFELMMAPYAIAHMKLGLKLRQTGYDFGGGGRLRVYLTNTLEEPVEMSDTLAFAGFLSKESSEAAQVKRRTPITVVVGNPPYANFGRMNTGEWITGLIRDWRPANEKKWNPDDFMKFLRWAQWRIECTDTGILSFITNNTYIDGITHGLMRRSLGKTFDKIYILDLHGSITKREKCPDGSKDENVFDIRQGVAIGIFVGQQRKADLATVFHADVWGLRDSKYRRLSSSDALTTEWTRLDPQEENYFVPHSASKSAEYTSFPSLRELAGEYISGVQTKKDNLFVAFSSGEVEARMKLFLNPVSRHRSRDIQAILKGSAAWIERKAKQRSFSSEKIRPYMVSPFDIRFVYYDPHLLGRARYSVMRHMLVDNIGLVFMRQSTAQESYDHFLAVRTLVTDRVFYSAHGAPFLSPLYLHQTVDRETQPQLQFLGTSAWVSEGGVRVPNLGPQVVARIEESLGLRFTPDGYGDLREEFGPEDVFHYVYVIFHSPTYRARYAESLKKDFPRLPLTSDRELFAWLVALGADLVALHLLEADYPAASWNLDGRDCPLQHPLTSFVEGANGTTMGSFSKRKCYEDGRVYLDTSKRAHSSYFDGVPEEVWNFYIGGYQVCRKWLYDRRGKKGVPGRTLTSEDIAHYQRIVVALHETIRLMAEIDEVIDAHGGWPIE